MQGVTSPPRGTSTRPGDSVWPLLGRGQGCCHTSYSAQGSPRTRTYTQMSILQRVLYTRELSRGLQHCTPACGPLSKVRAEGKMGPSHHVGPLATVPRSHQGVTGPTLQGDPSPPRVGRAPLVTSTAAGKARHPGGPELRESTVLLVSKRNPENKTPGAAEAPGGSSHTKAQQDRKPRCGGKGKVGLLFAASPAVKNVLSYFIP